MDKYCRDFIDGIQDHSFNYLRYIKGIYNLDPKNTLTYFEASRHYKSIDRDEIIPAQAYTISQAFIDPDHIIEKVNHKIYMTYESLYRLIFECRMDFTDVVECMKFFILHEIGHCIELKKFIGKPISEFNEHSSQAMTDYRNFNRNNKLRKNAGRDAELKYIIKYNLTIPNEIEANSNVGIDENAIIENFNRINRKITIRLEDVLSLKHIQGGE